MRSALRHTLRTAAVGTAALGLVLFGAGAASAHVTVSATTTVAGSYTVLTVSVPHGCDGSGTTSVAISMPEQIIAVTPTINQGWDVEKKMEKLDTPVDNGHGGQYTERVDQVVYTAKDPLPEGFRDAFELSLKLPEEVGAKLVFPAIQKCEKGETPWTEVTEEGADEPEHPAPFIVLTAAEGAAPTAVPTESTAPSAAPVIAPSQVSADSAASSDSGGSGVVGWLGLVLGAIGAAAGVTALVRSRKTS
ncbi:YcnI family copper-binding membrane protein [Herbidospora cretacea]|uniref:YcnI family copper-binding membrane protein n=1 Tax=Herbidospora cretacea TaxID=28444 RepID=UPI000773B7AB|nr:YcnI family protein [Herbidospora cretacea]